MILNFSVANWMSFRAKAELNLLGSSERQHGERVPLVKSLQKRVLPIAAIYGGNASGKTNLFRAMSFLQNLVVGGVKIDAPIRVEPFRLDAAAGQEPSSFAIEVLIDEKVWDYRFTCNRQAILSESLRVLSRSFERTMFVREKDQITPGDGVTTDQTFLTFAAKGTRQNQLYLTNTVSQKIDDFKPLYDWFRDRLVLVAPDSRFAPFDQLVDRDGPFQGQVSQALEKMDTGITELASEAVEMSSLGLDQNFIDSLSENLKEDDAIRFIHPKTDERIVVRRNAQGEMEAQRLISYHRGSGGERVRFDIRHESDGSQRVIDLLPSFLSLQRHPVTFVIDELDRSLHTHLTRSLICGFLESCSKDSRSQLLMTTHDVQLMDQTLLRRDEMWLVERNRDGASALVPFSDFNKDNRYDKDIRKAYLLGRMGGVPHLRPWRMSATPTSVKGTP